MRQVAALFVRADSIYKTMPGVDAWDADRDARRWPGGAPIVAHPPCAQWGGLRAFAHAKPEEKALGPLAVSLVRQHGGVLEHPAKSTLWAAAGLPAPGQVDAVGGWTLEVEQHWWGHRARKRTWLYIVGAERSRLPAYHPQLDLTMAVVCGSHTIRKGHPMYRPNLTKAEREHTPLPLAKWLVDLARRTCVMREAA